MLNSLFRSASAAALLFAAGSLPAPLLAGTPTLPVQHAPTRLTSPHARHSARSSKAASTIQTPFTRVMLPRVEAQQAKLAAAGKLDPAAKSLTNRPKAQGAAQGGTNGLGINFPSFLQPSLIATEYYGATAYTSIALTADVNKDGKPDLVTLEANGRFHVVLNSGTGLAATAILTDGPSLGAAISWASAVDLNGDGYPDLEAIDATNNVAYIFMNAGSGGSGTFLPATSIPLPLLSGYGINGDTSFGGDVIFADMTGDGKPDMVIVSGEYPAANQTSLSIQILPGVGDGTFSGALASTPQIVNAAVDGSYHSLQAFDINGDGKADLVFPVHVGGNETIGAGGTPRNPGTDYLYTFVVTGNSLGTFSSFAPINSTSPGAYAVGAQDYPYASYVGNFGKGSSPGIAVLGDDGIYSQLSNGDGTLQPPVASAIYFGDATSQNFVDVTGDGKVDAVSYTDGYISVYPGAGDGTFSLSASEQYVSGYAANQQPVPADFNGDGIVDLISVHGYGAAAVYDGLGGGAFKGAPVIAPPAEDASDISSILVGNLAGHGFADVLAYDYNNDSLLLTAVNDGKGNFTYETALSADAWSAASIAFVEPVTIDINNDGKPDLLLVSNIGLLEALNNGDGTFAAPVQIPLSGGNLGCALNYATVGDVNNDGKQDVVVAFPGCDSGGTTSAGFFTLLNNGDGTFTSSFTALGSNIYQVALADFNSDGNQDLVLSDVAEGTVLALLPGNGDGTFNTSATEVFGSDAIFQFLTNDFNGDGKPDLTIATTSEGFGPFGVITATGNGDFSFSNYQPAALGFFAYGIAYADLNGDGKPDLILDGYTDFDTYYEGIGYMANLGAGTFSTPVVLPSVYPNEDADFGYGTPALIGDFNSDGAPDFLAVSFYTSGIFYNTGGLTMALTTSVSTATQDTSVTLTSTLTPSFPGGPQVTGTITFEDNGIAIGTVPIANNAATLSLSTLPVGANVITAIYSGDVNYNAATSAANVNMTSVSVTALPAAFTLAAVSGASLDLTVGQTGVATFSVTGNATFNGPITLSCSGAPAGTSCTISPSTLTLAGVQTATFTAVLDTTAPNNHFNATNSMPTWVKTTGGITLAGGLLLMWPSRRRRNLWTLMLLGTLGLGAVVSLTGCDHKYSGTPAGTYNVTVTATAGSLMQTGTIALTIHQ